MSISSFAKTVNALQKKERGKQVSKRINEFELFRNKSSQDWFSELCFCLLTANAKFKTANAIHKELGYKGFMNSSLNDITSCIKRNKHRFHNNKAKYIVAARAHNDIKHEILEILDKSDEFNTREWLVANIKGLGYKEASHFLRNVGCKNLAIVDRHVLSIMNEYNIIKAKPKTVTKKTYFDLENKLKNISSKLHMSIAELDLYMWSMKTGQVMR